MTDTNGFFDFSTSLWDFFRQIDKRFAVKKPPSPTPASLKSYSADLSNIKIVLWDVYGTILGLDLGDLEKSLQSRDCLTAAAQKTVEQFQLEAPLEKLFPDQFADWALCDRFVQLIRESHLESQSRGIEYPEVVIEKIWLTILQQCQTVGYQTPHDEPPIETALRWAYFFDAALQKTFLYPGICSTLQQLNNTGIIQGIISNAQFYTPLHLRRLIRTALNQNHWQLDQFFSPPLLLFSYQLGCSKPNPLAFNLARDYAATLDIHPDQILYIGNDLLNDTWAADQAKFKTMLFAADNTQLTLRDDDNRCQNFQPNALVTHANQIAPMILQPGKT